jgi:hypothetical protein
MSEDRVRIERWRWGIRELIIQFFSSILLWCSLDFGVAVLGFELMFAVRHTLSPTAWFLSIP